MKIRYTTEKDFERIMEIYKMARDFMKETGNPNQWGPTNWPPAELLHNDIKEQKSYVCEKDGKVVGVFFFDQGENIEPTYMDIEDGQWIGDNNYGVIHRIAADTTVKGVGTFCINWAYDQCKHMRIDTHGDNIPMQKLLNKLGFEKCGTIYVVEDNYPRYAYEKLEK